VLSELTNSLTAALKDTAQLTGLQAIHTQDYCLVTVSTTRVLCVNGSEIVIMSFKRINSEISVA
jgi:hypothetical protein